MLFALFDGFFGEFSLEGIGVGGEFFEAGFIDLALLKGGVGGAEGGQGFGILGHFGAQGFHAVGRVSFALFLSPIALNGLDGNSGLVDQNLLDGFDEGGGRILIFKVEEGCADGAHDSDIFFLEGGEVEEGIGGSGELGAFCGTLGEELSFGVKSLVADLLKIFFHTADAFIEGEEVWCVEDALSGSCSGGDDAGFDRCHGGGV